MHTSKGNTLEWNLSISLIVKEKPMNPWARRKQNESRGYHFGFWIKGVILNFMRWLILRVFILTTLENHGTVVPHSVALPQFKSRFERRGWWPEWRRFWEPFSFFAPVLCANSHSFQIDANEDPSNSFHEEKDAKEEDITSGERASPTLEITDTPTSERPSPRFDDDVGKRSNTVSSNVSVDEEKPLSTCVLRGSLVFFFNSHSFK